MRKALVLVALVFLSGCTTDDPVASTDSLATAAVDAAPFLVQATPLRFASGDYNGTLHGEATFSIAEQCIILQDGCAGGEEIFDLSAIVPAEAPVELVVDVHGARASMEFIDASYIGESEAEFQGQGTSFANIVVRGQSGQVLLHVYNPGGFGFPPNPSPTASFDANSVVRSDRLVADVPASLRMLPGQTINLTSEDVEEAVFIGPDGSAERLTEAPFTFTANGTAGDYTILMVGQGSTAVTGPDTELKARRMAMVQSEPEPLASGSSTTWSLATESRPLLVGLWIESVPAPAAGFFSAGSTMTQFEASLTGPGNVAFIDETGQCTPVCGFAIGSFSWGYSSAYLDERLLQGSYDATVTYTGNGVQGVSWALVLA